MTTFVRCCLIALVTSASAGSALAQAATSQGPGDLVTTSNPRADNYRRMQRKLSIELTDARLEDAIQFLREYTSADLEVYWDDGTSAGLDKDLRVNVSVREQPALVLLERLLEKAQTDFDENTWQFSSAGTIEAGPKSILNRSKKLKIYDIHDMLFVIPDFAEVPELDVDSVLQQGQDGGGGSTNIFQDNEEEDDENRVTDEESAQKIIDIIIENIEPEQWQDNGGDGASVRFHNGTLLIRAPEYIHRQLEPEAFLTAQAKARPSAAAPTTSGRTITNRGTPSRPSQAAGGTPAPGQQTPAQPAPSGEKPAGKP
jgi:hypothetical protein